MISQVRDRGQVTLPKDIIKRLSIKTGDHIDIEEIDGRIVIKPVLVIPKDQAWFWTPEWQAGERAADEDIKAGRVYGPFSTAEATLGFLDSLKVESNET